MPCSYKSMANFFLLKSQPECLIQEQHNLKPAIYNAILPEIVNQKMVIPKSEAVMIRLKESSVYMRILI